MKNTPPKCENCGQYKMASVARLDTFLAYAPWASIIFLIWIPIVGWVLIPFAFLAGFITIPMGMAKARKHKDLYRCNHCGFEQEIKINTWQ